MKKCQFVQQESSDSKGLVGASEDTQHGRSRRCSFVGTGQETKCGDLALSVQESCGLTSAHIPVLLLSSTAHQLITPEMDLAGSCCGGRDMRAVGPGLPGLCQCKQICTKTHPRAAAVGQLHVKKQLHQEK